MTDLEYLKKYGKTCNLEENIKKLEQGIPVQYLVGNVDFMGSIIEVNENVLIPRFETEELVFKTIEYCKQLFNKKIKIVDLGTGSGCIAIILKKKLDCIIDAVDISKEVLEIAKRNSKTNEVDINFIKGNMLEPLNKKYDCIISNPPYISKTEDIMDIVKDNEPHLALYADNNGLYYYEEILKNCSNYLSDKYLIAFEIGCTQGEQIKEYALKYLPNCSVVIEKDIQGKDRFVFINS